MGNALREQGKPDEAIESYDKLLSLKPGHNDAFNNMGNAQRDQGKLEEAREAYNKALAIKPDYVGAKHMADSLPGNTTNTALRDYVENLIDAYATNFDQSLVGKLGYEIPKLLIIKALPNSLLDFLNEL